MAHLYMFLGVALVAIMLLDTFFTVLNYNQRGVVVNRAIAWEWRFLHWLFRPLNLHWRSMIYRTMAGFTLFSGILIWAGGVMFGFALIYYSAWLQGNLILEAETPQGFAGALYFSLGQFTTVGATGVKTNGTPLAMVSVVETLISVTLVSLVITYLAGIFRAINALRDYCACFPSASQQVSAPLLGLAPFLKADSLSSLDSHLQTLRESMNAYFDAIAADHSAIYFNSGKPRFMLPFAIFSTASTVEGLTYGLDPSHDARNLPELIRLSESFANDREQIYDLFRWRTPQSADPVSEKKFVRVAVKTSHHAKAAEIHGPGLRQSAPFSQRVAKNMNVTRQKTDFRTQKFESPEDYVVRFVRLRQVMWQMVGKPEPHDWANEYDQYKAWLGFVSVNDDFIRRTSHMFDYRPIVCLRPATGNYPLETYGWQSQTLGTPPC